MVWVRKCNNRTENYNIKTANYNTKTANYNTKTESISRNIVGIRVQKIKKVSKDI